MTSYFRRFDYLTTGNDDDAISAHHGLMFVTSGTSVVAFTAANFGDSTI